MNTKHKIVYIFLLTLFFITNANSMLIVKNNSKGSLTVLVVKDPGNEAQEVVSHLRPGQETGDISFPCYNNSSFYVYVRCYNTTGSRPEGARHNVTKFPCDPNKTVTVNFPSEFFFNTEGGNKYCPL